MRNGSTFVLAMSLVASWSTAGAQPSRQNDIAADWQSDGQQMPPNFDDLNRRGAGWENSPPAEPLPRSQPRNTGASADFGSGRPASDLDTQATAIRSTQEHLRRLDQAERDVKDDQDHLENLLKLSQAVVDRQLSRYSEMVAIGLMTPESVTTETRLGAAIINEMKRRLAETDKALGRIKDQRAALSLELQIMQTRQSGLSDRRAVGTTPSERGGARGRSSTVEAGMNRYGSDYTHSEGGTAESCRLACLGDERCKAWTWVKPGAQNINGVSDAHCWMKSAVPPTNSDANCTSGVISVSR